jgi:membrane protease YdiL (CAAX protease family)
MSLPLVWFLIRLVERHRFAWKDVGLDWRRNSLLSLAYGVLLALIIYVANKMAGQAFGSSIPAANTILAGLTMSTVMQKLALYIPMGFGEELVFRGYLQSRLVERLGAIWGILIASVAFTMLHLLFTPLSPIILFSGVILWVTIGALYHWSKSLYLVGMFHATANVLDNTLALDGSDAASLIVHSLALLFVVIFALRKSRVSSIHSNPA